MIELWEDNAGLLYLHNTASGWCYTDLDAPAAGRPLEQMLLAFYDQTEDWSLRCWDQDGNFYPLGLEGDDLFEPEVLQAGEPEYLAPPFSRGGEMHQIATFDGETFTITLQSLGAAARRHLDLRDAMRTLGL